MSWVYHVDGCGHLLLAAHPPSSLVLWDTDSGNKLWKKTYGEQITSFDLDPFDPRRLAGQHSTRACWQSVAGLNMVLTVVLIWC